jgi:hypothetical protein
MLKPVRGRISVIGFPAVKEIFTELDDFPIVTPYKYTLLGISLLVRSARFTANFLAKIPKL